MNNKKKCTIAAAIIVLLLLIDQAIKVAVKLNMNIGEEIVVFDWFRISFIENRGMAFGMEIGSKLFLSLFRIVAVGGLTWYIWKKIKEGARMGYIVVLSMIYAGAAGNIFDSLFYGEIFTASHPYYTDLPPAQLVPWGEGYASILMGNVVDMFSFPLFHGTFPNWFPVWGGEDFTFFSAIFNFADACISVGVVVLFLFYRNDFNNVKATPPTAENIEETTKNTEK